MSTTFADLGVSPAVARALTKRGIDTPFPIQKLVIEDVFDGEDVLVQSPTGSGKTLAFGLPLVDRVAADSRRPAALILAPTRELARQIVDELDAVAKARALKVAVVYGGVGIQPQIRSASKAHILVATPGRLEDLLERRALTLNHVRTLVLDEADRMLDMGFKPAVDRIVRLIPKDRQTLFFSATLEGAAGKLAATYTHNPRSHVHSPKRELEAAISASVRPGREPGGEGRPARRRAEARPGKPDAGLRPHQARRRPAGQEAEGQGRSRPRDARRQDPVPASEGARPLRSRRHRRPRRHRRRGSRDRRPRHQPRDQLRRTRGRATRTRTGSAVPAGPGAAASGSASCSATRRMRCGGWPPTSAWPASSIAARASSTAPAQRQPAKAQDGGRSHGHRQGGSSRGPNHQRKQGGGGSTGPKRRRRRRNPAGQSPRN